MKNAVLRGKPDAGNPHGKAGMRAMLLRRVVVLVFSCVLGLGVLASSSSTLLSPSGVRVSLVRWGENVWRLRSADQAGVFPKSGAVESLRHVLGETLPEPVAVCSSNASPDAFPLRFVNANGKTVVEVCDVARTPSGVEIRGRLLAREAVYGGGERFDRLNRRGTAFDLTATDGWNRDDTTYLPIPLFLTTRGGGFLVNRYETMFADFGKAKADEWCIRLEADSFDGWFFATRTMKEALVASKSLTGADETPPAWSRGPIICRYHPDLTFFSGKRPSKLRGKPVTAYGVKDIFDAHVALGVKPAAMLAEAWSLRCVLENPQERADFASARDYLRERGTRLMGYVGVGNPISTKQPGFKPEFLVHADMTIGDVTQTNTCALLQLRGAGLNPDASNPRLRKYLDITNPEAWNWYLESVMKPLASLGLRGLKIDFCEQLPDDGRTYGKVKVTYRWHDPSVFAHAAVHHAYPTFFTAKLYRDMNRLLAKEGGFLCFARGGGLGANRAPFYWAGDQVRTFPKLQSQLLAVLTSTMSGVPGMSFDMAGYQYRGPRPDVATESAVFARGTQMTAYLPCLQTHGFVRNVYELTPEVQKIYRDVCAKRGNARTLAIRPLALEFPEDANTWDIADAFMVGEKLLVAPVLTDATVRRVYLPCGRWRTSCVTYDVSEMGLWVTVKVPLDHLLVFERLDCPTSSGATALAKCQKGYLSPAAPGRHRSGDYVLSVNGSPVEVVRVPMPENTLALCDRQPYSYASFVATGMVEVCVESWPFDLSKVEILPKSKGVTPIVRSSKAVKFRMTPPMTLVLEPRGRHRALVISANAQEQILAAGDVANRQGVRFFSPGLHHVERIELKENETLYLSPGAWVEGSLVAKGKNMTVCGSGVLSGACWPWQKGPKDGEGVNFSGRLATLSGENITVRDTTFFSAWGWTLVLNNATNVLVDNVKIICGRVINDDGIDICRSRDVVLRNSFVRCQDDCIAPKWWCENLVCTNMTLWVDSANAFRTGYECESGESGLVFRNLLFKDIDVLHLAIAKTRASDYWAHCAIYIQPANGQTMYNTVYDDIRFYECAPGDVFLNVKTMPITQGFRFFPEAGILKGLTLRNIHLPISSGGMCVNFSAYDARHPIEDVRFENVTGFGRVTQNESVSFHQD